MCVCPGTCSYAYNRPSDSRVVSSCIDSASERLRRWTRNPLGPACRGSSAESCFCARCDETAAPSIAQLWGVNLLNWRSWAQSPVGFFQKGLLHHQNCWHACASAAAQESLAGRSKAAAQGAIPLGCGLEPHSCHFTIARDWAEE